MGTNARGKRIFQKKREYPESSGETGISLREHEPCTGAAKLLCSWRKPRRQEGSCQQRDGPALRRGEELPLATSTDQRAAQGSGCKDQYSRELGSEQCCGEACTEPALVCQLPRPHPEHRELVKGGKSRRAGTGSGSC